MAKRSFLGLFTEAAPRRNNDNRDNYAADDSEYYNDEYDSTPEYEETYSSRRGRSKSEDDEVYYTNLDRTDASASAPVSSARSDQSKNITQISAGSARRRGAIGSTVVYVDPEEVDVAFPLIDYLKEDMTIVLSLAKTKDDKEGRRIVDFMSGAACYAEAKIQRVAPQTFIITPKGVENLDKRSNN